CQVRYSLEYNVQIPNNDPAIKLDHLPERYDLFLYRRFFSYNFSFIVKFTFTNMSTMAYMCFASSTVCCQSSRSSLIVCPALCASLLTMSAFRIWHIMLFI